MKSMLVVSLIAAGVSACVAAGPGGAQPPTASASATGQPAAQGTSSCGAKDTSAGGPETRSVGIEVGQFAPEVGGTYLDGKPAAASGASKAVLVSFWSATCPRAAQVVPRLKQIATAHRPEDLTVIGPSGDDEAAAREFQKKHGIKEYRLIYGATAALEAFQVEEYPTAFLLGADRRIAWRGNPTSPDLDGVIASVLAAAPSAQPAGMGSMPPCCQMMMGGKQMGPNMMGMMQGMGPDMMKQMGMSPGAMERMMLLMRTPIFLDAPCPIFAQAETLGLTEDQKKKLGEIENEAREKARAVLTPEQQAKLGSVPDRPVTMMETCPMMKMLQGMQGEQQESKPTPK